MELNQTNIEPTTNDKIIRQNCLSHADAMIKNLTNKEDTQEFIENKYFIFAEKCETWVNKPKKRR